MSISDEFKKFMSSHDVGPLGFMVAVTIGNATYEFINSVVDNLMMPIIGFILKKKEWKDIGIGKLRIGQLLSDLISWIIMIIVTFLLVQLFLKKTVVSDEDKMNNTYSDIYEKNQLDHILHPDPEEIIHKNH